MTRSALRPPIGGRARWAAALGGALLALSLLLGATLTEGLADESPAMVQQGPKLTGGGEEIGSGRVGRSVALSADGNTALIGAPHDDGEVGAAWVLVRSGSTWTEQAKLTGVGEVGEGHFGRGVALSAEGDTALIGAPNDSGGLGAVWIFVRTGSTWTQQAKLIGGEESGKGWFGRSVALSADGDTALVGGFVDHSDLGAAWAFERTGSAWAQQGEKLTAAGESGAGEFGWSVALSADGDTALIGGHKDGAGAGAAWVFARATSTWAQQGGKLTGGEESGEGYFGEDVALSANGDTALIGGEGDDGVGAAWVFARATSTWAQQGEKLTGAGESGAGFVGADVALSADGDTALIGGFKDNENAGAAWLFKRAGSTWAQRGEKLTGGAEESGEGQFGWSVALSADGGTALVGGLADGGHAGAAWVFVDPPPPASHTGGEPPSGGEPQPGTPTQTQAPQDPPAGSSPGTSPSPKQGVAGFAALRCPARSRGRRPRAHTLRHRTLPRGRSQRIAQGLPRARASVVSRRLRRSLSGARAPHAACGRPGRRAGRRSGSSRTPACRCSPGRARGRGRCGGCSPRR